MVFNFILLNFIIKVIYIIFLLFMIKMINEGLKISFNDIKNGDFILFNKGTRKLWYI